MKSEALRRTAAYICIAAIVTFSAAASADPVLLAQVGGTPARRPAPPPADLPPPRYDAPAPRFEAPPRSEPAPRADNTAVRQSLDQAIAGQKSKRAWAISGFVVGGVVIVGGLVYTSVQAQKKANETGEDQFAFNWIGLGVGLPIIGISVYNFVGAQRKLSRLQRERLRLGVVPMQDGAQLGLALDF